MSINPAAFIQKENARLKAENKALKEEVTALREFVSILDGLSTAAERFRSDAELLPFLRDVLLKALALMNAPDGSLAILDEESNELVFVIVIGALEEELTGYRFPANQGIFGWVVQNAKPTLVRDVRRDQRFSTTVDEAFTFSTQSIAAAPLIGGQRVYGAIEVLNQPGDEPFSDEDVALLRLLCKAAGEALADIDRLGREREEAGAEENG